MLLLKDSRVKELLAEECSRRTPTAAVRGQRLELDANEVSHERRSFPSNQRDKAYSLDNTSFPQCSPDQRTTRKVGESSRCRAKPATETSAPSNRSRRNFLLVFLAGGRLAKIRRSPAIYRMTFIYAPTKRGECARASVFFSRPARPAERSPRRAPIFVGIARNRGHSRSP